MATSSLFSVRYNVPALKDVSIYDAIDELVFTLPAASREALPGGDVKITADSNGNVILKDTNTTPNGLYSTVPNETPIDNVDDLKAALADPTVATIIIDTDLVLDEAITISGYKLIQGTGSITADVTGLTIAAGARLVLDENISLITPDNTLGGVFGTINVLEGATITDEASAVEGWAWANGGDGQIILNHGDAVYEHGILYIGSGSNALLNLTSGRIILTATGILLDGAATVIDSLGISNANTLSFTPQAIATIEAGVTLTIGVGSTLNVTEGTLIGIDDTSIIEFEDGAIVVGTKAGIVAGTISPDESLKFDNTTGTWIAA